MNNQEEFFEEFSQLTSELIRKFKLLERDEKVCFNVTVSQRYTVEILYNSGPLSMKDLSNAMGVAVSTMTRVLDVMVRDGLVKRKGSAHDRRLVYINLTAKGKKLAEQLKESYSDYLKSLFVKIPSSKQGSLLRSLSNLLEALEQQSYCCKDLEESNS